MRMTTIRVGWRMEPEKYLKALEGALNASAKAVKVDFDVTTQTWKNRPDFAIESKPGERVIATTSKIYRFLNRGTRVRYAVMTADFRAKTRTGYIGSNAGRGGLAFVSKKRPRPGIKAREFSKTILEKWRKRLPEQVRRALRAVR